MIRSLRVIRSGMKEMYLADTNVVSETKKKDRANEGVRAFFDRADRDQRSVLLSVVTVAELRQGVFRLRHKGDCRQANAVEGWVDDVLRQYEQRILAVNRDISELWARLRVPQSEPALDKLIAATAIFHGLTVVTRNVKDFEPTGVGIVNPFD
jgi:toxin FitB